jgi:ATP-dependent Clp protease ATP-binding subunit ClpA
MLRPDEIDYLMQATRSSVKKYGGEQPSLSHLAQVLSARWSSAFDEVFGKDGAQGVEALLKRQCFVGDENEVKELLKGADDRQTVLASVLERLQSALDEPVDEPETSASAVAVGDEVAAASNPPTRKVSDWPSRTERYVQRVSARDDLLERDDAIDLVVSTLSRTRRRIPIVLGPPGTGRTTLMGGVAAKLGVGGESRLWRVDPGRLGPEPEGALDRIVGDCKPEDVLVIDDIDKLTALGSAYPNGMALRVLAAAAMREDLKLILICDARQFQRLGLIADDLTRQLVPVRLSPLSDGAMRQVVGQLQPAMEALHGVQISSALHQEACLPPRSTDIIAHPGLAADRLDAAASRACILGDGVAEVSHLASIHSAQKTPHSAEGLGEKLSEYVCGQDHAVSTVASRLALTLARLDLRPERPDGVFLFVGPTGVGKTKLARALSLSLFGSEESLIRLDMSEYAHEWAVSRLVGPMPGYVGSTEPENWLTTRVSQMPDCVLLLDEIEKANRVVWNTFLQVFDAGRLTDSRGLTADFANTVIVMTSNIGAAAAAGPGLGFGSSSGSADLGRQKIMSAVKEAMAPELINRIDEFVIFDPLTVDAIEQIAEHELAAVKERLLINGWTVSYEPEVVRHIASTSYDPAFGARHLQRNIERGFLSLVASAEDKTAHVVVSDGQLALGKTPQRKKAVKNIRKG